MTYTLKEKLESMGKPYYDWRNQDGLKSYNEKSANEIARAYTNLYVEDFYSHLNINPATGQTFLLPLPKEDWYVTQH